jgi:cytochrome P450
MVSTYAGARDAFRQRHLRQALYDAGEVVMADVLVNLHGEAHRDRRRLENRLFRRDTHTRYERSLFPPIVDSVLAPHLHSGRAELVELSHNLMMHLAAATAGVDRPLGTAEETDRLYQAMMQFIAGATLAHYSGDRAARRSEVAAALERFDVEFLAPSVERRRQALAGLADGTVDEDDLPRDVLTVLLRHDDELHLPPDVLLRETCFYLLAGAHTSATAFVRTFDNLIRLDLAAPGRVAAAVADPLQLQRCVHETIRLQPSSPVATRRALEPVELLDGRVAAPGDLVVVDLVAANRDPEVFGEDAAVFDPDRPLPEGVPRWGVSFGVGAHACIGQDLATGDPPDTGNGAGRPDDHLVGLVTVALRALLDADARPDPNRPARIDPASERGYWSTYPVLLGGRHGDRQVGPR